MYIIAHFTSTAERSVSPDKRHIRDEQHELCELTFEELRILNVVQAALL